MLGILREGWMPSQELLRSSLLAIPDSALELGRCLFQQQTCTGMNRFHRPVGRLDHCYNRNLTSKLTLERYPVACLVAIVWKPTQTRLSRKMISRTSLPKFAKGMNGPSPNSYDVMSILCFVLCGADWESRCGAHWIRWIWCSQCTGA